MSILSFPQNPKLKIPPLVIFFHDNMAYLCSKLNLKNPSLASAVPVPARAVSPANVLQTPLSPFYEIKVDFVLIQ